MEIETITAQSNLVNQFNPGDDPSFGLLNVRHSYMYLDNNTTSSRTRMSPS
jgi:hypothetical protein